MERLMYCWWLVIPLIASIVLGIKEYLKWDKDEAKWYFWIALFIVIFVGAIIWLIFLFKFLFTTWIVEWMLWVIALLLLAILVSLWLI